MDARGSSFPAVGVLGTRLRHLYDLLDAGVARVYENLGLPGFGTRYTPIIRLLAESEPEPGLDSPKPESMGPSTIRDLALAIGVTHSAVSQTVARMAKDGLVTLTPGDDARTRIVRLTSKAESLLPTLEAEWQATVAAAAEFDAELPFPLSELVEAALGALSRRPMHERISSRLSPPNGSAEAPSHAREL